MNKTYELINDPKAFAQQCFSSDLLVTLLTVMAEVQCWGDSERAILYLVEKPWKLSDFYNTWVLSGSPSDSTEGGWELFTHRLMKEEKSA